MVKKADIPRHLVDTALAVAADRGWRTLSLAEIAAAAKLPLAQAMPSHARAADRGAVGSDGTLGFSN